MTMAEQLPATGVERARLLFVDDEQRVLNSMRIMFRRQFDLFLASHGAEALDIVKDKDIDVIVADHRMPRMTGVEVLSKVRAMSPRTVRILLTGYADLDAVEGSINESEVFRFLTKPCAPKQLRETIELAAKLARETPAPEPKPSSHPPTCSRSSWRRTRSRRSEVRRARTESVQSSTARLDSTARMHAPQFTTSGDAAGDTAAPVKFAAGGLGIVVFSSDSEVINTVQKRCAAACPSTTRATSCTSSRS